MCNKCKWATYILRFINSHLSLLFSATGLPSQDSLAGTPLLCFLGLPHLTSDSCFTQGLFLQRLLCPLPALRVMGTPHFRWHSLWGSLHQRHPDLGVEEEVLCTSLACLKCEYFSRQSAENISQV
jgi:hypothetical protein